MSTPVGGLGRGLAAILTGPDTPDSTSLRARLIGSAMASLNAKQSLQLCGYIHTTPRGVEVTLRSPAGHTLHPTQAYQLFTALGAVADLDAGIHQFQLAQLLATGVVSETPHSRGLFFFGDPEVEPAIVDRLAAFCRVYSPVVHDHDRPADDTERVHLVLDQEGGDAHAEITVAGATGFGSAANAQEAVARAAIAAISADAKLVDVGKVRAGDGNAAFVVAAGEMGRTATGAAPVASGPDAAAAVAAVRAARCLLAPS